jgi:hypothetical protein
VSPGISCPIDVIVMLWQLVAASCAGLFAGAAAYISLVEHPARLECGTAAAVAEFVPSYRRATVMQASLAGIGTLAALVGWWQSSGTPLLVSGLLLGSVIPFTLLVILPTNTRLLDPALDRNSEAAATLLRQWGRLHLVRSLTSAIAFVVMLAHMIAMI